MRSEHEGMALWFEFGADAPSKAVPVGTDVRITVGVEPADASNRVEVRYRVNQGVVEKVAAAPVRHVGNVQYFRACLPASALHAGDRVEYLAVCHCVTRQVPSQQDAEQFVASFSVVGARNHLGCGTSRQSIATGHDTTCYVAASAPTTACACVWAIEDEYAPATVVEHLSVERIHTKSRAEQASGDMPRCSASL